MAELQVRQVPPERYSLPAHEQLVAVKRVKEVRQRVQVVAPVQAWQLLIAVEQSTQVNPDTYWVLLHTVQDGPDELSGQRVQIELLVHSRQSGMADEQRMQLLPLR